MRFLTVLALVFSVSASAGEWATRKLSFSPSTYSAGNTTWYNCDSVERTLEKHLKDLGASNVRLTCSGGIGYGRFPSPAVVSGKFDVPVSAESVETITLQGRESCKLNTEFLDYVLPMFPSVTVLSRKASCWGGRADSWKYTLQIGQ